MIEALSLPAGGELEREVGASGSRVFDRTHQMFRLLLPQHTCFAITTETSASVQGRNKCSTEGRADIDPDMSRPAGFTAG